MPKAKKSNTRSSLVKDFDKQKTKLGKGKKAAASNATNTSFKARSIALTQQSITKDRSSAPTIKRNLTVEELIGQTRHYSASVRRNALVGLKEIYQSHEGLIVHHLGLVVPNISRLMSDEDASVRTSLHSFFTFYLGSIPSSALQPYSSTLLLYTTSAMSHIYPDVRLDAVRILDLLYPALGTQVTMGWQHSFNASTSVIQASSGEAEQEHGERVLRCYLSLLGLSTDSNAAIAASSSFVISSDLSAGARLLILRSMRLFFSHSSQEASSIQHTSEQTLHCPTWFFDPYFASLPELSAFKSLVARKLERETADLYTLDETCAAMSDLDTVLGKSWTSMQVADGLESIAQFLKGPNLDDSSKDHSGKMYLFQILSPLLLSVFFDAAPTAFSPSQHSATSFQQSLSSSAQLVCVVVSLTLALWRGTNCSEPGPRECLSKLLSHMATYFPFGQDWDNNTSLELMELNLSYCELVSLLAMISRKAKKKEEITTMKQMNLVSNFVVRLLSEEGRQDRARQPLLRGRTFVDLIPTIWLLLNVKVDESKELIEALLLHWNSLKAHDPTKRVGVEFLGMLWLLPLQRSYVGTFTIRPASPHRACLVSWLTQSLPRYLWELHAKDVNASALVLEVLRLIVCQTDGLIINDKEVETLSRPLAPFFQVRHATRGDILGPYTRLPVSVQRIAKGLLTTLDSADPTLQKAARAVGASSPILIAH